MRKGGGKEKGSEYERVIARRLSMWVTGMQRDDVFWRSSISGGKATMDRRRRGRATPGQEGDIGLVDPAGQGFIDIFLAEVKHYRDLGLDKLVTGTGGSDLHKFWARLLKDAKQSGRYPFLVAKQNFLPEMVGVDDGGRGLLQAGSMVEGPPRLLAVVHTTTEPLHLFALGSVLSGVSFERLRKAYELSEKPGHS